MRIDWSSALRNVAAMPEVKRLVTMMKNKGLADHLIDLGFVRRPSSMVGPAIGFFAAGAVFGAAAALLVTLWTGEALRQDVAEIFRNLRSKVSERVDTMREVRTDGSASPATA